MQWKQAMEAEYDSLVQNRKWESVPILEGNNVVWPGWTYKI